MTINKEVPDKIRLFDFNKINVNEVFFFVYLKLKNLLSYLCQILTGASLGKRHPRFLPGSTPDTTLKYNLSNFERRIDSLTMLCKSGAKSDTFNVLRSEQYTHNNKSIGKFPVSSSSIVVTFSYEVGFC